MGNFKTWEEFRKELNITPEQEEEIRIESEIIQATVEARKNEQITQEELSQKTGLKQSAIARVEKGLHSPSVNTLLKILNPLGYTLQVVPIKNRKIVSKSAGNKVKVKHNNKE